MKMDTPGRLDALCGEYMLGTLRGAARRRFERALREEPRVALQLGHWQSLFIPRYSPMMAIEPSPKIWQRLDREIGLDAWRTPWYRRAGFWRGWSAAATIALVLAIAVQTFKPAPQAPAMVAIAEMAGKPNGSRVAAHLSPDGRTLELHASRPVLAGPAQSYELWLIPAGGGAAISVAVLGSLDARFDVPAAQVGKLHKGAKLAVTVEPAGGSPQGVATGPVIMIGEITV